MRGMQWAINRISTGGCLLFLVGAGSFGEIGCRPQVYYCEETGTIDFHGPVPANLRETTEESTSDKIELGPASSGSSQPIQSDAQLEERIRQENRQQQEGSE